MDINIYPNFCYQTATMTQLTATKTRIQSIDLLRGIVIVIMALDHVRDFFHIEGATGDPTDMETTSPMLFFTRWITHFCAPVFIFLAGTSGFLQGLRKTKKQLSLFLIKRGLWLVLAELILISFGITFDPGYHFVILQVIWAIGTSMIILGLLVWLPFPLILIYGLGVFFLHNLLDAEEARRGQQNLPLIWKLFHGSIYFKPFDPESPARGILGIYAILPWSGVMALGYCFGKIFRREVSPVSRKNYLLLIGSGLIVLFIILRFINQYGDTRPWSGQTRGDIFTFLSFLNTNKYPPSLMYLCMTLGPAIIILALIEKVQNSFSRFFVTYGRVPFFFYILHFYLIHLVCLVFFYAKGYGSEDIVPENGSPIFFRPPEFGFNLWGTYAVWIAIVLALYPLCRMYDRYKTTKRKWWTSYL
jgi:uncharacterized membrane protein